MTRQTATQPGVVNEVELAIGGIGLLVLWLMPLVGSIYKGKVKNLWPKVLRASNQLENAPIWIDTSSDLSVLELRASIVCVLRRASGSEHLVEEPAAGRVVVDHDDGASELRRGDRSEPRVRHEEAVHRARSCGVGGENVHVRTDGL